MQQKSKSLYKSLQGLTCLALSVFPIDLPPCQPRPTLSLCSSHARGLLFLKEALPTPLPATPYPGPLYLKFPQLRMQFLSPHGSLHHLVWVTSAERPSLGTLTIATHPGSFPALFFSTALSAI